MTPHEKITAVYAALALLVAVVGWLFHWWVLDVRYWLPFGLRRQAPDYLPGPVSSMPAPGAGEYHYQVARIGGELTFAPYDEWEQLDPDQAADQLIAEWHAPDNELTAEDWIARDLADLELLAWDARVQAARCWEIVHVEFPRLRAELCAA